MSQTESRRRALYNGLHDLLGAELADTLMTYLPASTDLATKTDINDLKEEIRGIKGEIGGMKGDIRHLSGRIDGLSERMDRMQQTVLAGFVAMAAAVLASGFLG
ncbi:MAG: hypothetical protein ACRDVD_00355 [Acidimicrobiia bacterium]